MGKQSDLPFFFCKMGIIKDPPPPAEVLQGSNSFQECDWLWEESNRRAKIKPTREVHGRQLSWCLISASHRTEGDLKGAVIQLGAGLTGDLQMLGDWVNKLHTAAI